MNFSEKILNFIKREDPQTWWREYPPKFTYRRKIIDSEKIKQYLNDVFGGKDQQIGVYIQIPFCRSRCRFCKFYSEIPKNQNEIDDYLDCLEKEIYLYGINFKNMPLDNLYIGGGTPTILSERQWRRLFQIIHKFFVFKKGAPILTEGTPETSTLPKLKLLKSLGISRFTIGAQSFDDEVLKKANRIHDVKDIYRSFGFARKAGISFINLDILLGLSGEKWDSYLRLLKGISDLKPDCVSFMTMDFGSFVDPGYEKEAVSSSCFFKQSLKPKIFLYLNYILEKMGYEKAQGFSDSTYVLRGRENSVNRNLLCRNRLNPVFGIGNMAESSLGHLKYYSTLKDKNYCKQLEENKLPYFVGTELSRDEYIRRYFVYNSVLWRKINKKDFFLKFGEDIKIIMDRKFQELENDHKIFDAGDDLIFLPNFENIERAGKFYGKNYGNQELSFLFCVKYFYSPRIINQCKKYLKYYEDSKNRL